jgi:hypothetical protein
MIPKNFILTTLSQNPEYCEDVIALIEEEFHYSDDFHYERDFAPLMDPLNFENCYLYIDNETNTVAAHLAVCVRTVVKNDHELKVALIGGIATRKTQRGKHLFTALMNHAIKTHEDNVGLFILWSDLENLYEKFSFYRTGGFLETGKQIFTDSDRPSGFEKTTFSELSDKDFSAIMQLYKNFNQKHFFTVARDEKDWSIIREMNSINLFIKRNSKNEIEKYFCIHKGRDLTNIIHEVSCSSLVEYHTLMKKIGPFKVWLPESESIHFQLNEIFYTAFMRLGSETRLKTFLEKVTQGDLKMKKKENDCIHFTFKNEPYEASTKNFLQYLFGPKPLKEFESFHLSLYVAGADSI